MPKTNGNNPALNSDWKWKPPHRLEACSNSSFLEILISVPDWSCFWCYKLQWNMAFVFCKLWIMLHLELGLFSTVVYHWIECMISEELYYVTVCLCWWMFVGAGRFLGNFGSWNNETETLKCSLFVDKVGWLRSSRVICEKYTAGGIYLVTICICFVLFFFL